MSRFKNIVNYFFPSLGNVSTGNPYKSRVLSANKPNGYISPVQFTRQPADIQSLREAISEAEQAYYPHRVKLQRIYQDTIRNGQVEAAMNKRRDLTLLKDFEIRVGDKVDEKATELIRQEWFKTLMGYCFDAKFYGYTLVGLGDMENNQFNSIQLVKRWNVSPDRHNVTAYVYSLSGIDFLDPEVKDENGESFYDWTVYVDTPSETGASPCGYGLLYKIAYYEILIRNTTGYNATYLELFGQPLRKGVTNKTDEYERAEFAAALRDMGSSAWILLDQGDEVELVDGGSSASSKSNSFESFEQRQLKMISKIVFGHADAMDSQTGKLGGEDSAKEAICAVEKADNSWMETIVNSRILPKLENLGFPLPMGATFHILNNREKVEAERAQDAANKLLSETALTMKNAGFQMDAEYFKTRTGIELTEIESKEEEFTPAQRSVVKNLYKPHH